MIARFPGTCQNCGRRFPAGTTILWSTQVTTHLHCPVELPLPDLPEWTPAAPKRIAIEEAGVYVLLDGTICKVQANQSKTHTYALRWHEIPGERLTEAGTRKRGEYEYEAGLVAVVAAEGRKMTLDEAKAFILQYGICCRCGIKLVAADSVERGIGPVCIKYFQEREAA
jgi:hypothetical protein